MLVCNALSIPAWLFLTFGNSVPIGGRLENGKYPTLSLFFKQA